MRRKGMVPRINLIYTAEAAKKAGISKATLLRWLKEGKIPEVARDVRGWRVFSDMEIGEIRAYVHQIIPPNPKPEHKQKNVKR
jgi:predicted DNA-binding transcriptional regulator AlpA